MKRVSALLLTGFLFTSGSLALSQPSGYKGLGAESVPPELVAKYAAPPLDPAVSRRIQTMLDVRAPGLGVVAPDGSRLYFGWRITGTPQVFRLTRRRIPGPDDGRRGPHDRRGDHARRQVARSLARRRRRRRTPGSISSPRDGGPLKTVQKVDKVQTFFDFVTRDGKELYFHANDVAPDSYAIYKYDLASGAKTLVFGEKGLWSVGDHAGQAPTSRLLLVKATGSLLDRVRRVRPRDEETHAAPRRRARRPSTTRPTPRSRASSSCRTNKFGDFRRSLPLEDRRRRDREELHSRSSHPPGMDVYRLLDRPRAPPRLRRR